jgi:phosphinothricin acetyltransferase
VEVVDARAGHLPECAAIYAVAAEDTAATFDLAPHPLSWWEDVLAHVDPVAGNELIVAVEDDVVLGWAKSGPHREKAAYDTTRETTLYVHADHRGKGVGHALYRELLERLDRSGLVMAVAGVTQPNEASDALHRAHGFESVGVFEAVGVKFGRPWDVRWYQRPLAGLERYR